LDKGIVSRRQIADRVGTICARDGKTFARIANAVLIVVDVDDAAFHSRLGQLVTPAVLVHIVEHGAVHLAVADVLGNHNRKGLFV